MKKFFILLLALIVLISAVFVSCSGKTDDEETTKSDINLENSDTEVGFEKDENGEEVAVAYETDKDGKTIAVKLDEKGEKVTDKDGNNVTVKTDYQMGGSNNKDSAANKENTAKLTTTTTKKSQSTTQKADSSTPLTSTPDTTKFNGTEAVPKTSASGKKVNFSAEDQNIIKSMLEVPYLYLDSYENSDGVPISIACHTAVWMAEREGNVRQTYPSSPIVLNLFYYYGQTVINFKTQCNEFAASKDVNAPIHYNKSNDTFDITEYTAKKQTVSIASIEDLGGNNFYKVTANVSGCNKKKVVAIIQKNRLEATLGFSVKALKWS
ncbi:MAG: hypothetical protein NC397_07965 [Clostridium sp.]|nr:hypothetical protein [Clostridium sp.]